MTASRRPQSGNSIKWLFALIVFLLAMTITFSDVYGNESDNINSSCANTSSSIDEQPASVIPETVNLILLGGALSALYVVRRRRNMI